MLEELVSLFKEAEVEGVTELRERMSRMFAATQRRFGPMPAVSVGVGQRSLPEPDFLFQFQIPYYHQAASLLVERREEVQRQFGLTPIQAYTLLLKAAMERGVSPNRLARSMVTGLGYEPVP